MLYFGNVHNIHIVPYQGTGFPPSIVYYQHTSRKVVYHPQRHIVTYPSRPKDGSQISME